MQSSPEHGAGQDANTGERAAGPGALDIAVVGLSALLPGADGPEPYWRNILSGRDLIRDVPDTHWLIDDYYDPDPQAADKTYAKRGAFLDPVAFDPLAFGIPPKALEATDTTQLLALVAAQHALEDATGGDLSRLRRERVGVVVGTGVLQLSCDMAARTQRPVWLKALREGGMDEDSAQRMCDRIAGHYVPWQEATFPGLLGNVVAGRIANRFDLNGPNCTVDAACASSLAALAMATDELVLGRCDMMLAGGADTLNDILWYLSFSKTPALSPTGDCRPFSENADGTMLGEGLVLFALKRLADAERDGDRVHAVLRGLGASSDGRGTAIYAPLPQGQERALRRAYDQAGYSPRTVELVEAHGTGTAAGDVAEFRSLASVFGAAAEEGDPAWCAVGSVKSQIGHTKGAAGGAGLLKAILALRHRVLPPTYKVERPNPRLPLGQGPLYLNTEARPWVRDSAHPRRASVSSFGFGGSNFHLTVEEYRPPAGSRACLPPRVDAAPCHLFVLGADGAADLAARARSAAAERAPLANRARAAQLAFDPSAHARLAVVAADAEELARLLDEAAAHLDTAPDTPLHDARGVHCAVGVPEPGPVAFLFSGQGSQYPGMGSGLALHVPQAQEVWDQLADWRAQDGTALHHVVFPPPAFDERERHAQAERLTATEWAQPALAAQALAHLAVLDAVGVTADLLAGHSFGELVALHAAGVLNRTDLLAAARRRGELLRDAAGRPAGMTAVGCGARQAEKVLEHCAAGEVWVANHNGPEQTVLSGTLTALEEAERAFGEADIVVRRLRTSGAFHTPLVQSATEPFAGFLDGLEVSRPDRPVYANATAAPYPSRPQEIRKHLAGQLTSPVRFAEQIEAMYERGARTFVELGAGNALTSLTGRILQGRTHVAVAVDRRGEDALRGLHNVLGALAAQGRPVDFAPLWAHLADPPVSAPADAAEPDGPAASRRITILGTNYGKPYPHSGEPLDGTSPVSDPRTEDAAAAPAHEVPAPAHRVLPTQSSAPPLPHTPATVPAAQGIPGPYGSPWLHALQEAQRQATETHASFQRSMADSHIAFLRTVEAVVHGMSAALGAAPAALPSPAPAPGAAALPQAGHVSGPGYEAATWEEPPPGHMQPAPVLLPAPAHPAAAPSPFAATDEGQDARPAAGGFPVTSGEPTSYAAPVPGGTVPQAPVAAVAEPPRGEQPGSGPGGPSGSGPESAEDAVLEVVAELTGYPADVLKPELMLDTDLGIDSIKRVQILSSLRKRFPQLPRLDAGRAAGLRTLGEVAAVLRESLRDEEDEQPAIAASAERRTPHPEALPEQADEELPLQRLDVAAAPVPAPDMMLPGLADHPLLITDDGAGTAAALVEELTARGLQASVCTGEVPADTRALVSLDGLRPVDDIDAAYALARDLFRTARRIAPAMREGGVWVTVQDTGGDFGLAGAHGARAGLGGIAGLARTAAREWPAARVKAVDCARGQRDARAIARVLAEELLHGGAATDVGLPDHDARRVLVRVRRPAPGTAHSPSEGGELREVPGQQDVLVVTGGARGVTAECVVALARAHRPRLLLLGRSALREEPPYLGAAGDERAVRTALIEHARREGAAPEPAHAAARARQVMAAREVTATLAACREAGAQVRYAAVDSRDRDALARTLDEVRAEWGPITGVLHGAGVLADRRLEDKTDDEFDRVFTTKVDGLEALLAATAPDPLRWLCVFSSVAGRAGNAGQSDYAMANETLNHLVAVHAGARPGLRARALVWGAWDGGMVTPHLAEYFAAAGTPLISRAAGARALVAELAQEGPVQTVLVPHTAGTELVPAEVDAPLAEVRVGAGSHPHFAEHAVGGRPVVPLAYVAEWFARLLREHDPYAPVELSDLRVLRGIALEDFGTAERRLLVRRVRTNRGPEAWQLQGHGDGDGAPHYRVTPGGAPTADGFGLETGTLAQDLGPLPRTELYDGHVLFHGPAFQVVRGFEGVGPSGARGELAGVRGMDWRPEPWITDPAAVDGALQLAGLWAEHLLGGPTLPMGIGRFRWHRPGPVAGTVPCTVYAGEADDGLAVCDVLLGSPQAPVAELLGVQQVLRPS
ncbi:SDR family NAD(P)-dependent oxidoreductase [Streptomyces sp. WAC 04229]|uniref:SDR family NAD(P)-dependent oxidoreductase n=1 Tax=Streptomyces sp. WAC 04229 TaxID=2203206 RepID=UPI003D716C1D